MMFCSFNIVRFGSHLCAVHCLCVCVIYKVVQYCGSYQLLLLCILLLDLTVCHVAEIASLVLKRD